MFDNSRFRYKIDLGELQDTLHMIFLALSNLSIHYKTYHTDYTAQF
jgi:hypothetical protein